MLVGQYVALLVGSGIVRFHGRTGFAPGVWVGVELEEPVGKNDGSVDGKRYFDCVFGHGIFVRESKARVADVVGGSKQTVTADSQDLHQLQALVDDYRQRVTAANERVAAAETSLTTVEDKLEMLVVDREVLETENTSLRQELELLHKKYVDLKAELDALVEESEINRELEQLVSSNVDVSVLTQDEIKQVMIRSKDLEQKYSTCCDRIDTLLDEIASLTAKLKLSESQLASFSTIELELARSKEIVTELQDQLDTQHDVDQLVSRLTQENEDLTTKLHELESTVAELTELQQLDGALADNHSAIELDLKNSLSTLQVENEERKARIELLEASNERLRLKVNELINEVSGKQESVPFFRTSITSTRLAELPDAAIHDSIYTANEISSLTAVILEQSDTVSIDEHVRSRYTSLKNIMALLVTSLEWSTVEGTSELLESLTKIYETVQRVIELLDYHIQSSNFLLDFLEGFLNNNFVYDKFYMKFTIDYFSLHLRTLKGHFENETTLHIDATLQQLETYLEKLKQWGKEEDALFKPLDFAWYRKVDELLSVENPNSTEFVTQVLAQLEAFLGQTEQKIDINDIRKTPSTNTKEQPSLPADNSRIHKIRDLEVNIEVLRDALLKANVNHQKSFSAVHLELVSIKEQHTDLTKRFEGLQVVKADMEKELFAFHRFEASLARFHKDSEAELDLKKASLRALAYKNEADFLRRVFIKEQESVSNVDWKPITTSITGHLNPLGKCGHYLQRIVSSSKPVRIDLSTEWKPQRKTLVYQVAVQKERFSRYEAMREATFANRESLN